MITRRHMLLAGLAAPALLTGCDRLGQAPSFRDLVLERGEAVTRRVQRWIVGDALAREYTEADLSPDFRTNGSTSAEWNRDWVRGLESGWRDWALELGGLVDRPRRFTLAELQALPQRRQITRHDCVEGWSAIGGWEGPQLSTLLNAVGLRPEARFIVFHCADQLGGLTPSQYYESIDLREAFHPQTILAHRMNDAPLPVGHGAPLRLRVERQLGYKQAKFLMRIEAVSALDGIGKGRGGYWEDAGWYEWYAGI